MVHILTSSHLLNPDPDSWPLVIQLDFSFCSDIVLYIYIVYYIVEYIVFQGMIHFVEYGRCVMMYILWQAFSFS